jgi:hypothetical protein
MQLVPETPLPKDSQFFPFQRMLRASDDDMLWKVLVVGSVSWGPLKEFVEYVVTQGQNEAESLFYAKLPDSLRQQDENLLSQAGVQAMATSK